MQIAQIILQQLGGCQFIALTGSKNFVSDGNTLRMSLSKNKIGAKYLHITLTDSDLYTMDFMTMTKNYEAKSISKFEDVYFDMLQNIFEDKTGLYTSLYSRS